MSRPDLQKLQQTYDDWYRQAGAAHWEEAPGKDVVLAALRRTCDVSRPMRLLDVGCGFGSFLARVHREVSQRWDLYGIDLSAVAVGEGRRRFPELHLEADDATAPAWPVASFDVVTCYGSWEHFPEPAAAIGGASRLLVPGGRVFAMIPALGIHRTDRDDEGWYEDTDVPGSSASQWQWNLRRSTWARMFEDAGVHLIDDSLARVCGAHKPGVFFFGVKGLDPPGEERTDPPSTAAFLELSRLTASMARGLAPRIAEAAAVVAERLRRGGKVLACGNGGSAADAQHFVAELVGRLRRERSALPALSLSVDPSVVTAVANDFGYEKVFARQVEGLGCPEDVLLVISTSGRSANVLEAVEAARQRGLAVLAVLGRAPLPVGCDVALHVPHDDPQRVQEVHTVILHVLCEELEQKLTFED